MQVSPVSAVAVAYGCLWTAGLPRTVVARILHYLPGLELRGRRYWRRARKRQL